jgi:hypothetical protein
MELSSLQASQDINREPSGKSNMQAAPAKRMPFFRVGSATSVFGRSKFELH